MIAPRYFPFVFRQVWRHRTRSALTIAGVGLAMFLFMTVQSLQQGVERATSVTAADQTLVVYRENRFCPAASRLPEYYGDRIAKVPGVADVMPVKIVVNNCRASLDVITFRGIDDSHFESVSKRWKVVSGSLDEWRRRSDAAVVGELLARRRGFKPGDSFDSSGVTVNVAAIVSSDEAQDQNAAYVNLPFLQRAAKGAGAGIVTQFTVKVKEPAALRQVGDAIDAEFKDDAEPTWTRPEKAFVAQAGEDIVEIVGFTRYLGWGALFAVMTLLANAIVLGVQDRVREHAVLQTLGFRSGLIARLIVTEGLLMGVLGGGLGTVAAAAAVRFGGFSLSTVGLSINVSADAGLVAIGLVMSGAVGVIAGIVPAIQASRREIAQCFRAV